MLADSAEMCISAEAPTNLLPLYLTEYPFADCQVYPREFSNPNYSRVAVDSGTERNGLGEVGLSVPAKLAAERGLERGQGAEALAGREIVAEHDLLQLGVAQRVEIEVPGQVALPVPGVLARPDGLGPVVVNPAALGDGGARLPGPPPATSGPPAARRQLPQLLTFLVGAVDEGVDGLGGYRTEPAPL